LIVVLCLLVYRLAAYRLRARLAATEQTIPDQVQKPTAPQTMRWVFQCQATPVTKLVWPL
jgi:transposase